MTNATAELIEVQPIKADAANEYNKQAVALTEKAQKLVIKNQAQYEDAATLLKTVKGFADNLDAARKKITKPLDDAKKAVMDLFRSPSEALIKAEGQIKSTMIAYSNEQERIRAEQERILREKAAAEESRQRKIKEDQERQWREKEEAKRREAEELAKAGRAEEARKAQEAADKAAKIAEERRQQASEVYVPAPTVAPTIQKPSGVSMKQNWKARVINEALVPREYLIVDVQKLDKIAKAVKGSLSIPGVEMYAEDVLASR